MFLKIMLSLMQSECITAVQSAFLFKIINDPLSIFSRRPAGTRRRRGGHPEVTRRRGRRWSFMPIFQRGKHGYSRACCRRIVYERLYVWPRYHPFPIFRYRVRINARAHLACFCPQDSLAEKAYWAAPDSRRLIRSALIGRMVPWTAGGFIESFGAKRVKGRVHFILKLAFFRALVALMLIDRPKNPFKFAFLRRRRVLRLVPSSGRRGIPHLVFTPLPLKFGEDGVRSLVAPESSKRGFQKVNVAYKIFAPLLRKASG